MTSFEQASGADNAPSTTPPPEPILLPAPPKSRVKEDPILWDQACEFSAMLAFCRPDRSKAEQKFINKYLIPLDCKFDKKGNIYKQIGDNPIVLWSSHTDTVHRVQGQQKIEWFTAKTTGELFFQTAAKSTSSCLGADDTTGVWLMTEMIKANIPGLYVFHRGEEVGGIGSKWIAENNKEILNGIRFAIAFDRRDTKSIITYQRSTRCCSDDFAKSLAAQLGMGHECDTGGSFTDTASYVDLIPECTNVSVGYYSAHCMGECVNVDYLFRLRDALLKLDVSKLVEKRKPGENDRLYQSYSHHGYGHGWDWDGWGGSAYGNYNNDKPKRDKTKGLTGFEVRDKHAADKTPGSWMDYYEWDIDTMRWYPIEKVVAPGVASRQPDLGVTKIYSGNGKTTFKYRKKLPSPETVRDLWRKGGTPSRADMIRMVKENPEAIADLLEMDGYGPAQILDHLLIQAELGQTIHL